MPSIAEFSKTLTAAKKILGTDLIDSRETRIAHKLTYSSGQRESLIDTFPNEATLHKLKARGCVLMATANEELSFFDICTMSPEFFYSNNGSWFADPSQHFAFKDKIPAAKWLAVHKEVATNPPNSDWYVQRAILLDDEFIPSAAELAWAILTFKKVREKRLFQLNARTSSVSADGRRVCISHFNERGVNVMQISDDHANDNLGIARSVKL